MLTAHPQRIQCLRDRLPGMELDGLLVLTAANRRYLSGFLADDTACDESAGALLLSQGQLTLTTDGRYVLQARREAPGFHIHAYRKGLEEALPELLTGLNILRLGVESARISVRQFQRLEATLAAAACTVTLVPTDGAVENLRQIKDETEVAATRKAVACAEQAFEAVLTWLRPGISERAIARRLEEELVAGGAEGPSFPIIVASGPNSALPHAQPGERKVRCGEPLLLDWGARLEGYCSDISRTVVLGEPDARYHQVFAAVAEAQSRAISAMATQSSGREVDAVARRHIAASGFPDAFGHSLGHGTGLAIHEAPRLSPHADDRLQPGMIVTVEPGIYLEGWGGVRLENQVLITPQGPEILNHLPLAIHLPDAAARTA
jgi:Xaa-Pro aminopeptidase